MSTVTFKFFKEQTINNQPYKIYVAMTTIGQVTFFQHEATQQSLYYISRPGYNYQSPIMPTQQALTQLKQYCNTSTIKFTL